MKKNLLLSLILGFMLLISVSGMVSAYEPEPFNRVDTFSDGTYLTLKNVFDQGETVYGKGWDGPNNVRLVYSYPNGTVAKTCPQSYSTTYCDLDLAGDAPVGTWGIKVQYQFGQSWNDWDSDTFTVNEVQGEEQEEPTCEAVITDPQPGEWYDPVHFEWEYEGECNILDQELYYQPAPCNGDTFSIKELDNNVLREYDWNPLVPDGTYCLCVFGEQAGDDVFNCVREIHIDTTPPVVIKDVGKPSVLVDPECNPQEEECDYYVNQQTPITLSCDDGPDGSGVDQISYRINGGNWNKYTDPFTFHEDSEHVLEVQCCDKVDKCSEIDTETFYVDTQAPVIEKTVGEPKVPCSDFDIIMMDEDFQNYTYTDGEDLYNEMDAHGWVVYDNTHPDAFDDVFLRDEDTPGDYYVVIRDDSYIIANFNTLGVDNVKLKYERRTFSLESSDRLRIRWRVGNGDLWTELEAVKSNTWDTVEFDLPGAENKANIQVQFFLDDGNGDLGYVDDVMVYGNPYECDYFVTQDTPFTLTCEDLQPHPVDDVTIKMKVYWSNNGENWQGPVHEFAENTNEFTFTNHEDSWHKIEYWCEDALGNPSEHQTEIDIVDSQAPNTIKWYEGPQYKECLEGQCCNFFYQRWIGGQTEVVLKGNDLPINHPIKQISTNYKVSGPVDDSYCYDPRVCDSWQPSSYEDEGWNSYTEPFTLGEESCHIIEYYSVDGLGNTEDVDWQCTFVDETPPITHKEVGQPAVECTAAKKLLGICEENWDWLITMNTPITLSCEDQAPHPSGENKLCWRLELDGVEAVGQDGYSCDGRMIEDNEGKNWCCEHNGDDPVTIYFNEESEHLLEFKCIDNVWEKSEVDSELFKVEGNSFEIPLLTKWNLISIPFSLLDNDVEEVFAQISDDVETVWGYENGEWHVYDPDGPNDLGTLEPGYGYWVKSKEDTSLLVGGSLLQPAPGVPPSRPLDEGWSLIGHYGTADKPAYCGLFSLVDTQEGFPRWSSLIGYDAASDQFIYLNPEDTMSPGQGFWLEMDIPDNYNPSTVCWGAD